MLKKIMVGAIVSVFLLAGCSNGTEKSGADGKTTASATLTPENQLAFYEDAKKNERVWLHVYTDDGVVEKDSLVDNIVIAKDGKLTIYKTIHFVHGNFDFDLTPITISDLNGKSFEELKKLGIARDKEHFEANIAKEIDSLESKISTKKHNMQQASKNDKEYQEEQKEQKDNIAQLNKEIEKLKKVEYKSPKATEISIATETDASGNTTIDEDVFYEGEALYKTLMPMPVVTIYDTHYGGYVEGKIQDQVLLVPVDKKYVGQIVTKLDDEVKEK